MKDTLVRMNRLQSCAITAVAVGNAIAREISARKYRFRIEHRAVHAHALHGRSLLSSNFNCAARATADSAGHIFFQRDLTGQMIIPRELGNLFQHGRRTAGKDFDLFSFRDA